MAIMNSVKSGADLTHPKPSFGWIIGAIVAFAVLGVALWIYRMTKNAVTGNKVTTSVGGLESQASKQLEGFL